MKNKTALRGLYKVYQQAGAGTLMASLWHQQRPEEGQVSRRFEFMDDDNNTL
jgi:hypothetical protein